MSQTAIPFLFLRGGSSRGPYFKRADLPAARKDLAQVLIAALGAGHPLNIDGIGGGAPVTTKVAMLSPSASPGCDIDYLFAQVAVEDRLVDFKPTCGNILSGVGPAAIEMGLVPVTGEETALRIHSVNIGASVDAVVQTPGGRVRYDGQAHIDGVPGTAAPVMLNFHDVLGSTCGSFLPTGQLREEIEGIAVTCMDVAVPMVIARAESFGLTGQESAAELDAHHDDVYVRMESIRIEAGRRMGLGDVSRSVTPKFGFLAPAQAGGSVAARYFMPWSCHPSMAVTGAQCLACCLLMPGTVAEGLSHDPTESPALVTIEHPTGQIRVTVSYRRDAEGFSLQAAGLLRTARMLARGELFVPEAVWSGADRWTAPAVLGA
ncbi:MAG: 4-oxalomesaconate tautomerase [Rhodospirillales bacterium]